MKNVEKHLAEQLGLPDDSIVPGVYTNGFVSFTIVHIKNNNVLLYANADIPYLNISEDDSLEITEKKMLSLFQDILADFRLTHAGGLL